jgi:hypothetical protein
VDIGEEVRIIEVEPEPIELRPEEEETPVPAEAPSVEESPATR